MDNVILVTGANRGIGKAIAAAIGTRLPSSTIVLACREATSGESAIKELRADGITAKLDAVQLNIEQNSSITEAVETIKQKFGKLDVLINNAIKLELPKTRELDVIRAASNANYNNAITSNAVVTEAFLPLLRKSTWPRVIMVSSTRGSMGRTFNKELPPVTVVDYCIAKAGLNMLTLQLQAAEEQRDESERITFWTTSPGHCKTGFNGFRGHKDPLEGAEVVLRLLLAERGAIPGGTFWEFENGSFHQPPW